MNRRRFITLLGGAAAAWPLTARAQKNSLPIVGFLNPRSQSKGETVVASFRQGLRDAGYEEGRNVVVEYRWAEDRIDRLPALAADLVARGVAVIVAGGGAWVASKGASSSIPIVFTTGLDPVGAGMVKSLNRPEANLTGASFYSGEPFLRSKSSYCARWWRTSKRWRWSSVRPPRPSRRCRMPKPQRAGTA
jgi:putative ABC transport system substrate-binding protein